MTVDCNTLNQEDLAIQIAEGKMNESNFFVLLRRTSRIKAIDPSSTPKVAQDLAQPKALA